MLRATKGQMVDSDVVPVIPGGALMLLSGGGVYSGRVHPSQEETFPTQVCGKTHTHAPQEPGRPLRVAGVFSGHPPSSIPGRLPRAPR